MQKPRTHSDTTASRSRTQCASCRLTLLLRLLRLRQCLVLVAQCRPWLQQQQQQGQGGGEVPVVAQVGGRGTLPVEAVRAAAAAAPGMRPPAPLHAVEELTCSSNCRRVVVAVPLSLRRWCCRLLLRLRLSLHHPSPRPPQTTVPLLLLLGGR